MGEKVQVIFWYLNLLIGVLSFQKLILLPSLNEHPNCGNVCSDATNPLGCRNSIYVYVDPSLSYNLKYSNKGPAFKEEIEAVDQNLDKLKIVWMKPFAEHALVSFGDEYINVTINELILSITNLTVECVIDRCRMQSTTCPSNGQVITYETRLEKVRANKLKISFSCIQSFAGPLSRTLTGVQKLDFTGNLLEQIPTIACEGLPIVKLVLRCNRIKTLIKNSFRGLSNLTHVDLSLNYISVISKASFEEIQNLKEIQLNGNQITHIKATFFNTNSKLKIIRLSENLIRNVTGQLTNLTELEEISFENNRITKISKSFFNSNLGLKAVNLQNNSLKQLPFITMNHGTLNFANNSLHRMYFPLRNVSRLDLSFNCLQISVEKNKTHLSEANVENITCWNCCLDNHAASVLAGSAIMTTDLRHNPIRVIDNEFLKSISHLKTVLIGNEWRLNLNFTFTYATVQDQTVVRVSEYSFLDCDIIYLLRFIISNTQPQIHKRQSKITFELHNITIGRQRYKDADSAMEYLFANKSDVICAFPHHCPVFCECYTVGLDHEVVVNCSGKNLSRFPNISEFGYPVKYFLSENKITQLPKAGEFNWNIIQELYLENNKLEMLENLVLHSGFHTLQLQNNSLKYFSPIVKSILTSQSRPKKVLLSGNPWECACNATEIKSLMITADNVVDFERITCKSIINSSSLFLKNVVEDDVCFSDGSATLFLLVIAAFMVLLSSCSIVGYHYRNEIRLWLFIKGYCLWFAAEENTDKTFDAFISYSSNDENWVGTYLVPELENGSPSYTVCVHNRNWPVGALIAEMVYESLNQSRRTIIVLTDNYARSEWCRFEFQAAYSHFINEGLNQILAVVPENVPLQQDLTNDLESFITQQSYLKWDHPHFWRKLRLFMPRVKPCAEENDGDQIPMLIMDELQR